MDIDSVMDDSDNPSFDIYQILNDQSKDLNNYRAKFIETYKKMTEEINSHKEKLIKHKHLNVTSIKGRRANSVLRSSK